MPGVVSRLLYQIYMKWFPIALPAPESFKGQTALVTGGTGGLGLAAAAHLVNLGAAEVIVTSRDPARAREALRALERETRGRSRDVVRVVELDMNRYASVIALVDEVKKVRAGKGGLDFVLLNAGLLGTEFTAVDEGWWVFLFFTFHLPTSQPFGKFVSNQGVLST
jgi:NAD(P)-dependent dehydrogenase (short-subunit alcohol dehydrogenase family)